MSDETEAHDGLEQFARSNAVNYSAARTQMIEGDADSLWRQLEYARENRCKVERACVLTTLRLMAGRGTVAMTQAA